ncbi:MAG TPA: hypothetical protein VGM11_12680, partial [Acidobacteriaceae bacterium]
CAAFASASLYAQSQPDSSAQPSPDQQTPAQQQTPPPAQQTPAATPQNPAALPPQTAPAAQSPSQPQPAAQQPGTLPEQPASAAPQQPPAPVERATPAQPSTPPEAAPQPNSSAPENPHAGKAAKKDNDKPVKSEDIHNASIWQDPGNIASKDMFHGAGGVDGQPVPPFKFVAEDMNGTNPKADVEDANGKKWRMKLGEEARPEVVASRLLWATGYYVNDDYLLHVATIEGLDMKRGEKRIHNGEQVIDARFARKPGKDTKIGIWEWKSCPFRDTREFNGLRVMMAVLNSWDLKDVNNAVYTNKKTGHEIFLVSDIGATFATNSLETSRAQDKGNVKNYVDSKFITKTTPTTVDFGTPGAPTGVLVKTAGFASKDYFRRKGFEWIGQDIPREDARWIGSMLGQLSHQQLEDAFRAGNFPAESIDQYVAVLETRIAQLKAL